MSTHHEIPATPETMVLGYFDAALPPVLTVKSGDTVTLHSHPAGGRESLHPDPARGRRRPAPRPRHPERAPARTSSPAPSTWRRRAGRHAAGRHPRPEVPPRLGFVAILPLLGTLPDEFTEYETVHADIDTDARPRPLPPALGHGAAPRPVLRHHGHRPAPRLGPGRQPGAPRLRRQHGQQGIEGRHDPLPAGVQPWRRILRGRRPRRAGRRRGLHHRPGDRADRHVPPHRAQGSSGRVALRRDAHRPDVDRPAREPRRGDAPSRARDGAPRLRTHQPHPQPGLHAVLARREPADHPDGRRQQGRAHADAQDCPRVDVRGPERILG